MKVREISEISLTRMSEKHIAWAFVYEKAWIHHNTNETKEQSKQWTSAGVQGLEKILQIAFAVNTSSRNYKLVDKSVDQDQMSGEF